MDRNLLYHGYNLDILKRYIEKDEHDVVLGWKAVLKKVGKTILEKS